jgi:hypothetical protein
LKIPEGPLGREILLYLPNNEGGRYIYAKGPPWNSRQTERDDIQSTEERRGPR